MNRSAVIREWGVTVIGRFVRSIKHSPLQINPIFIVLLKPILDPAV
jgi:hypothetical protein